MSKPSLLVIAGCNGSGKSSFSNVLTPENVIPFDYDYHYLKIYNSLMEFDLRDRMAHNSAWDLFNNSIEAAISSKNYFCYETNFNSSPLHWPNKFKEHGYEINMIYFCLESVDQAIERVTIRVENGGHHVPSKEIQKRFYDGYKNLNKYYPEFDNIHLLNSSFYNEEPHYILSISNGVVINQSILPLFLADFVPDIYKLCS